MNKAQELREKIAAWLKKNYLEGDVSFYTEEEWKARREPFGNSAVLSLTFEGPLYSVLNGCGEGKHAAALYEEFVALGADFGLYLEQGYAWSAHWYPA